MTKLNIRKKIAERKKSFQGLELLSEQIVKKLQTLELFQTAKTVGTYMPLPDEVDISPLFQTLEKQFYIPAFDAAIGSYRLAQLSKEFNVGKFGILEPVSPVFAPEKLDLIIVPGIAFDRAGHRIGRGGGFYDRLLPQYHAVRVGACFGFQCLETVPAEPHDCRMDVVVSG